MTEEACNGNTCKKAQAPRSMQKRLLCLGGGIPKKRRKTI
ncbi:hypothetical protein B4098_2197 [Heyndrickxia coagulans]|uniref:Uncharacterized protein n=1 Tax=Heyndrickxia coagulans TaxID=1398 RepID=A0A150K2N5_HEYCO|nr:hypothetical protein B4098_2197 [Heyndrickxia coagulans]